MTDAGFKLGQFWGSLVGPQKCNKAAVEAVLADAPRPAVYERELAKYEAKKDDSMPVRDKAEALHPIEREGKAPPSRFETDDGIKLGGFWEKLVGKRKRNKAAVEAVLRPAQSCASARTARPRRPRRPRTAPARPRARRCARVQA